MNSQVDPTPSKSGVVKRQRKERLLHESYGRCILCGRSKEEVKDWSIARIITRDTTRDVTLEGKVVICSYCTGDKHQLGVGEYASSLAFRSRLRYLLRVWRMFLGRRIDRAKRDLLLSEFILCHKRQPPKEKNDVKTDKHSILMRETNGTCIYCGNPLAPPGVTYDHILPRSLGGRGNISNLVVACQTCNSRRSSIPVDEFVGGFTEYRRRSYVNRVKGLVAQKRMPPAKARLLLSEDVRQKRFRFRLFTRMVDITVKVFSASSRPSG